jgi:hypothetical protein
MIAQVGINRPRLKIEKRLQFVRAKIAKEWRWRLASKEKEEEIKANTNDNDKNRKR